MTTPIWSRPQPANADMHPCVLCKDVIIIGSIYCELNASDHIHDVAHLTCIQRYTHTYDQGTTDVWKTVKESIKRVKTVNISDLIAKWEAGKTTIHNRQVDIIDYSTIRISYEVDLEE